MMDLKRAEKRADKEGWIDADDLERELGVSDVFVILHGNPEFHDEGGISYYLFICGNKYYYIAVPREEKFIFVDALICKF